MDTIFWASVLLIFLITILSAMLRRLAKDKALKLFDHYHVTFFSERRPSLWGDCSVFSQGVELVFDHPFMTRREIIKSSALVYEDEFAAMIALTRSIHGLTERENRHRTKQIHRTFTPGIHRRFGRWFRNLLNTLRDAISKTMNLMIGRFTAGAAGGAGAVISTQAGDINALTGTVVGLAANAYEPLLERYIGQAVVVEINLPPPPGPPPPPNWIPDTCEFPGYLVDYSQRFLAVFNVEHTPVETLDIKLQPNQPAAPNLDDLKITVTAENTLISCSGKDAFVLRRISRETGEASELGIALVPGTSVLLAPIAAPTTLTVERTRRLDLVVPRGRARIRFGAASHKKSRRWPGVAPILEPKEMLHSLRQSIRETLNWPLLPDPPEESEKDRD